MCALPRLKVKVMDSAYNSGLVEHDMIDIYLKIHFSSPTLSLS